MIVNPLIERGRINAKQETLIHQMQLKFGAVPQAIVERVQSITEATQLDTFLSRVITTNRLDEMRLGNGVVTGDSLDT
jgi:hypothetical protein